MLRRFTYLVLWILPVLALAVYIIFLRVQARFIERVELDVPVLEAPLSGLDRAIAEHAGYVLGNGELRNQIMASGEMLRIDAFYIDKYEVRQSDYRQFLNWYVLQGESGQQHTHVSQPADYRFQNPHARHPILGKLALPATGVSFYEAYTYCSAVGGSLPNREQWIAAAAGKENRSYPWGEKFVASAWRYSDPLLNLAAPDKQRQPNASPEGVYDLGNGLSEWTLEITEDKRSVLRGGNSYNRPHQIHALNFIARPAPFSFRSKYTGFRCVYQPGNRDKDLKNSVRGMPWGAKSKIVRVSGGSYFIGIASRHYAPKLLARSEEIKPSSFRNFLAAVSPQSGNIRFGKYEVSRAQYRSFLRDPFASLGFYANKNQPRKHSYRPANWQEQTGQLDLPVVGIDWWSAYAFAKWAGGRLPTEREWLYAFGGDSRKPYPWGNAYQKNASHVRDLENQYTPDVPIPVRKELSDKTKTGVVSMAGNISEWTSSFTPEGATLKAIVKGGNYRLPGPLSAYYSYYAKIPLHHKSSVIGIRVVFD